MIYNKNNDIIWSGKLPNIIKYEKKNIMLTLLPNRINTKKRILC